MMSFKENYPMVGLSADWIYRTWKIREKKINEEHYTEVVVFENEENENELLLLLVEYHGEDFTIQTCEVFNTHDENEMTTYLEDNHFWYDDVENAWMHKDSMQRINKVENFEWVF